MERDMLVEPYLFFDGKCEEAIEFYKRTVGAEVTALLRWKDSPDPQMANTGVRLP
jgi:PhnB protein